jgi:NAD(P)-dependent dehydrogenase (short-subunit alcohol dehydrogenase family)
MTDLGGSMQSPAPERRVAVVTGGARGIGDAIARALIEVGATIFSLDKIAPEQPREGVRYIEADVSEPASVADAFVTIDREAGQVDILVNNAGIQRVGLIGRISFEDWSSVISTHLNGFFLCASQAVPRMIQRGQGGAIVSIASTAAFVGIPGRGPYCAAKAGILGLTRAMALEVASSKIRVNAVAPGYTRTKLIDQALIDGSLREDWMLERVPLKRLASPEEIAGIVRFLTSEEAAYITGQVIVADGGWTVQGVLHAPDWLNADESAR